MKARWVPYIVAIVACIPARYSRADANADLKDAATRIEYAFYTADKRALQEGLSLATQVDASELPPGVKEYYLAFGQWKLVQLSRDSSDAASAKKAAQECLRHSKAARSKAPRMAEAYAIESICGAADSSLLSSGCDQKSLRAAQELEPRNPRIQLVSLMCAESALTGESQADKLRGLATAFEQEPPRQNGPGWGHAESLVMLGQSYLRDGDQRAARDALERALVIAPDYRKAQQLLQDAAAQAR